MDISHLLSFPENFSSTYLKSHLFSALKVINFTSFLIGTDQSLNPDSRGYEKDLIVLVHSWLILFKDLRVNNTFSIRLLPLENGQDIFRRFETQSFK